MGWLLPLGATVAGAIIIGRHLYRNVLSPASSDGEGPVDASTPRRGPALDPWEPEGGVIGARVGASAGLVGLGDIPAARIAATTVAGPQTPKWIVEGGFCGRGFGPRRTMRTGQIRPHSAIDITARRGTPISVFAPGTVEHAGFINGFGNCILVRHFDGMTSWYAHASRLLVSRGDVVDSQQVIAEVGDTGFDGMGNHLHCSLHRGLPAGMIIGSTNIEARYGIDPRPWWAEHGIAMVRELRE
jgi:murein DD-endopeptidase MepM/ murein hydrolase activator NlpD